MSKTQFYLTLEQYNNLALLLSRIEDLERRMDRIEKAIGEPIAQRVLDAAQMRINIPGTSKYTHLHFCKTCQCHEDKNDGRN